MSTVVERPGDLRPGRGWALGALYPVVGVLLALFVAYPLADLLARAVLVDGRLSAQTLVRLVTNRHVGQVAVGGG